MNFWKNLITCGRCQDIEGITSRFEQLESEITSNKVAFTMLHAKYNHLQEEISRLKHPNNHKQKSKKTIAPD